MSEPIIIETPAPPTCERLVLVPPSSVSNPIETPNGVIFTVRTGDARDATPDDLERAGWVPSVGDGSFAAVCDVIQRAHRVMHTEPGSDLVRECARVWREGREAVERAEKAERERDDLLDRINDAEEEARCRGRERDTLRAEVARLTAPGEGSEGGPWRAYGEPTDQELVDAFEHAYRNAPSVRTHATAIRTLYRLGVAHERARHVEKDRATDEELEDLYNAAFDAGPSGVHDSRVVALRAVAARVRQERCLVAQAVGMGGGRDIGLYRHRDGRWQVRVGEFVANDVPPSDVPATLARLLEEVARG